MKQEHLLEGIIWNGQDLTDPRLEESALYYLTGNEIRIHLDGEPENRILLDSTPIKIAVSETNVFYACTNNPTGHGTVTIRPLGFEEERIERSAVRLNAMCLNNGTLYLAEEKGLYLHAESDLAAYRKVSDRYIRTFSKNKDIMFDSGPRGTFRTAPEQFICWTNYSTIAWVKDRLFGLNLDRDLESRAIENDKITDCVAIGELPQSAQLYSKQDCLYYLYSNRLFLWNDKPMEEQNSNKQLYDFGCEVRDLAWVPRSLHRKIMKQLEQKNGDN